MPVQQINSMANLDREGNATMFFIIKEEKETVLDFLQGTVKICECKVQFIFYQYKMTQYNSFNVKLSNLQLNKLKSAIKNETEVVLRFSSNRMKMKLISLINYH